LHKEVEVSDARKIKIVAQKLTGNTSFFWWEKIKKNWGS
jgi:hypothetical protein